MQREKNEKHGTELCKNGGDNYNKRGNIHVMGISEVKERNERNILIMANNVPKLMTETKI